MSGCANKEVWLPQPELQLGFLRLPDEAGNGGLSVELALFDEDPVWGDVLLGRSFVNLDPLERGGFEELEVVLRKPNNTISEAGDETAAGITVRLNAILALKERIEHLQMQQVFEYQQLSTAKEWIPMQSLDDTNFVNVASGCAANTLEGAVGGIAADYAQWKEWRVLSTPTIEEVRLTE